MRERLIQDFRERLASSNGVVPALVTNEWLKKAMLTVAAHWDDPLSLSTLDRALGPEIHDHTRPVLLARLAEVTQGLSTAQIRALANALPPDDGTLPPFDRAAWIVNWFRHHLVNDEAVRQALLTLAGDREDRLDGGLRSELEEIANGVSADQLRAIAGALAGDD
jgi:hypothetical protein